MVILLTQLLLFIVRDVCSSILIGAALAKQQRSEELEDARAQAQAALAAQSAQSGATKALRAELSMTQSQLKEAELELQQSKGQLRYGGWVSLGTV